MKKYTAGEKWDEMVGRSRYKLECGGSCITDEAIDFASTRAEQLTRALKIEEAEVLRLSAEKTPSCRHISPESDKHKSDCAVHNEPAFRNGRCDCGVESDLLAEIERLKAELLREQSINCYDCEWLGLHYDCTNPSGRCQGRGNRNGGGEMNISENKDLFIAQLLAMITDLRGERDGLYKQLIVLMDEHERGLRTG